MSRIANKPASAHACDGTRFLDHLPDDEKPEWLLQELLDSLPPHLQHQWLKQRIAQMKKDKE